MPAGKMPAGKMPAGKMHADEVETDVALVRRLLAAQFPHWADLPIEPVRSAGTDNAIYRLGGDMAVRLPRIAWAIPQVEKEHRWLPVLAPHLPLAIPVPLAMGTQGEGYPWYWSVQTWLEGENASLDRITDQRQAAIDLAQFVAALQQIDPAGGPLAGSHNFGRGEPLAMRDNQTREAIAALHGMIDTSSASEAWEAALMAPAWHGPPVWVHGDLQSGNLLAVRGRLSAVIDFGGLGVGDPACDVMTAWLYLASETRDVFREALQVDDATWARGRGWALSVGLIALPYYRSTNPILAGIARRAIDEVLADHNQGL
ncbi:MAG TPA: aminoglycoside phosphotransferase family protein [Chloroflexia bacterium]